MIRFSKTQTAMLLTCSLLALSTVATAQELARGEREVVGYVGGIADGGGAGTFGGGYGYAYRPRWLFIGELGFVGGDGGGFELGGNAHYLFPLRSNPTFTPYALVGIGVIHSGGTEGGVNFGGGARWKAGKNWGIRPEIKFLAGNHFATRFTAGIYYQFGK
jgi:hypothetical protein